MNVSNLARFRLRAAGALLLVPLLAAAVAGAGEQERSTLVLTSTNDAGANAVVVFKLEPGALSYVAMLPTGGQGGAAGNAGLLQFRDDLGAVANFGSNTVTRLVRDGDDISAGGAITLAPQCVKPDSVALSAAHLFVVGANCAESHAWPQGYLDGAVVGLSDPSSAQIAVGTSWAAVTQTSGSVLQLPLAPRGGLAGTATPVTLPATADNTPLGAAFWGNLLGFTPAHSPDSFALVDQTGEVFPITGPTPPYPTNAPCWVAKGPGNAWYAGNSPGHAISIFFSDDQGGVFYKSIPLPGAPTDVTVSADGKWLAVIYSAAGQGYVAVYAVDRFGGLTAVATSPVVGIPSFSGVAFSQ